MGFDSGIVSVVKDTRFGHVKGQAAIVCDLVVVVGMA
jgi:hypothetical protein